MWIDWNQGLREAPIICYICEEKIFKFPCCYCGYDGQRGTKENRDQRQEVRSRKRDQGKREA